MNPAVPVSSSTTARSAGCSGATFAEGLPGSETGVWLFPLRQQQLFIVSQQECLALAPAHCPGVTQGASATSHPRTARTKALPTTGT